MAKETKSNLVWHPINQARLPLDLTKLNERRLAAYKEAKAAQEAFEEAFIKRARKADLIDDSSTLKFSYRFGKLSFAKANKLEAGSSGHKDEGFSFS